MCAISSTSPTSTTNSPSNLEHAHVLVVDDEQANRHLLRDFLRPRGVRVTLAADGEQALELAAKQPPDLVLLDVKLPGIDGREVARRLKQQSGTAHLPIIFITAYGGDEQMIAALDAGGDAFITKPIRFEVLLAKMDVQLRTKGLYDLLDRQNHLLTQHNRRLSRENELVSYFFERALNREELAEPWLRYQLTPMSMFNGDVLLVARRPSGGRYLLLGDFTGHGLTAAMGTLPITQCFHEMALNDQSLYSIVRTLNRHLHELLPADMFLTAYILEFNAAGRPLQAWVGGMHPAYVIGAQGLRTLDSLNMPLGIVSDGEFAPRLQQLPLVGDERIYLYTDGMLEASNSAGELFGQERLATVLRESSTDPFAAALAAHRNFVGEQQQQDDIALVEIDCGQLRLHCANDSD